MNNLVKGLPMRKKLHNSKGYAETPEFLPALGLIIFKKKSVATRRGKLDPCYARLQPYTNIYIYTDTNPITLPCSLVCAGNDTETWCL